MHEVTVLLANYNSAKYIDYAINSILAQSYKNFKFIIVDDASTDISLKIIEKHSDNRILIIKLKTNVGQTKALNIGLSYVTTKYVVRMDSDDYSYPNRLSILLDEAKRNNLDFIGSNVSIFNNEIGDSKKIILKHLDQSSINSDWYKNIPFIHGSLLIKMDSFKKLGFYDSRFLISADLALYNSIFKYQKFKYKNSQEILYSVRKHIKQNSRSIVAINETITILNESIKYNMFNKHIIYILIKIIKFYLLKVRSLMRSYL